MRARVTLVSTLVFAALPVAAEEPVKTPVHMGPSTARPHRNVSPMHPAFPLLDASGEPTAAREVEPSAPMTCGGCHDVGFIHAHSSHPGDTMETDCFECHSIGDRHSRRPEDFDREGRFTAGMGAPDSAACGQCHGLVVGREGYLELSDVMFKGDEAGPFGQTLRVGEVYSPQLIAGSFLNLADKRSRQWPWDIHAARGLECSSCHFSANNPERSTLRKQPLQHLRRDPRSLSIGAYLKRPDHRLEAAACTDCHDASAVHQDLPYAERHMDALACQACHVPELSAPALRAADHTVVTPEQGPCMEFRGVKQREWRAPNTWYMSGYRPFLLAEVTETGSKLSPHNLVAHWHWTFGANAERVPNDILAQAWRTADGSYPPGARPLFDSDGDGKVAPMELRLDTPEKTAFIRARLEALGVEAPRITGTIVADPVRHGVMEGRHVAADCEACHGSESRFNETIVLSERALPGGVVPVADEKTAALLGHRRVVANPGRVEITGDLQAADRYILGHSRQPWSDWLGTLFFVLTVLGVIGHAGLRYLSSRRHSHAHAAPMKRVYMYGMYERLWHWTMAIGVILLLISGLQLHYPQNLGLMAFRTAIFLHNIMAGVIILNAVLALFFHLATGEIRQFVPQPHGFIRRVFAQALYYGKGIFVGAVHPIRKTADKKLNPLQQITYVGLLNVLFPLQIATGVLLWVGGRMPEALVSIGGLSIVSPIHNLISWLFLSFLVMHVYLTTTGHTLVSNLQAMVDGWEQIEVDEPAERKGVSG